MCHKLKDIFAGVAITPDWKVVSRWLIVVLKNDRSKKTSINSSLYRDMKID